MRVWFFKGTVGRGFTTEWTVSGDASARTISLPLVQYYNTNQPCEYNCKVKWGDGTSSIITSWDDLNREHTYAANGTYIVEIIGKCDGWGVASDTTWSDRLKCTDIIDWGHARRFGGFKFLRNGFRACTNLKSLGPSNGKILASSTGTVSGIQLDGFHGTFQDCTGITAIPPELFKEHVEVSSNGFYATFRGCSGLTGSIPTGLFDNNTKVSTFGFYSVFYDCIGITAIPVGLFDNNIAVSTYGFRWAFFNCIGLTEIPDGLFDNNVAVSVQGFFETFRGCTGLTGIPDGLFDSNVLVSENGFQGTFRFCIGLLEISEKLFDNNTAVSVGGFAVTFQGCTGLTAIPEKLFDNNTLVSSNGFLATFKDCTGLTSIPSGLFDKNIAVSDGGFKETFMGCINLETVPSGLLKENINVGTEGFFKTFCDCNKLQVNPWIFYNDGEQGDRFKDKEVSFYMCFSRGSFTGVQGTAPDLWNCDFGTETPESDGCFGGMGNSTTSLSNYDDIPAGWIIIF